MTRLHTDSNAREALLEALNVSKSSSIKRTDEALPPTPPNSLREAVDNVMRLAKEFGPVSLDIDWVLHTLRQGVEASEFIQEPHVGELELPQEPRTQYTPCGNPYPDCTVCSGTGDHEGIPCSSCVWRRYAEENIRTPEEVEALRNESLQERLKEAYRVARLGAAAIRKRAEWLRKTGYTTDHVMSVRHIALWLESESGQECVLEALTVPSEEG